MRKTRTSLELSVISVCVCVRTNSQGASKRSKRVKCLIIMLTVHTCVVGIYLHVIFNRILLLNDGASVMTAFLFGVELFVNVLKVIASLCVKL